jgi:hypothetical protein
LDKLPENMTQLFDAEKVLVSAMTFAQMKALFEDCQELIY